MPSTDRPSAVWQKICGLTVFRTLPMVHRALVQNDLYHRARTPAQNRRRVSAVRYLPQPYHAPADPNAAFHVSLSRVELAHSALAFSTQGAAPQGQGAMPTPLIKDLDRRPWHPFANAFFRRKIERIEPQLFCQQIKGGFPERWPIAHAEPRKRRLRWAMGVHRPAAGAGSRGY